MNDDTRLTRRAWLTMQAMADGQSPLFVAIEAVSSTAIEHPEWDMNEVRTWQEWERDG